MNDKEKAELNETLQAIKNASDELVKAAMKLNKMGNFENTVTSIKETIGDLTCAIKMIEDTLTPTVRSKKVPRI